jgi:hypothetical protein
VSLLENIAEPTETWGATLCTDRDAAGKVVTIG